ncbi:hypothetical protein PF005_g14830 [Phytophthora fragariae]|uniref:Uncharacterized protein n=1 Tax=Phytophthora fragariae TaxID=53985 RepID=A0A6A3EIN3_9STRA|nr:hypothetical protein PF003_g24065 [Phytophthora fragariae]KAE8933574.1 hypothetical protein PF009_g16427 [Phytophthora fragariae]KAE9000990.1 hypothetical protein PF011_g13944 [Phytophthora fragariae]KAE9101186.1 hypothetical protein PF007_g15237 [Phytophthora fragariae]KAE9103383.1 hypothetical protein PF010_g13753 [Phytophthora fragariae]
MWGHPPRALILTVSPQCSLTVSWVKSWALVCKSVIGILTKKNLDLHVPTSC